MSRLTVHAWWRLAVTGKGGVLRWSGSWVKTGRALRHVPLHTLCLRLLLWRRSKARTTLCSSTGHDALEQVGRTVANSWRWWLGRAGVRRLGWAAARVEFSA